MKERSKELLIIGARVKSGCQGQSAAEMASDLSGSNKKAWRTKPMKSEPLDKAENTPPIAQVATDSQRLPQSAPRLRKFGALRGHLTIGKAFDDPLPEEELAGWE